MGGECLLRGVVGRESPGLVLVLEGNDDETPVLSPGLNVDLLLG